MKQKLLILIGTLLAVLPLSAEIITGNYGAVTSGGLKGSNITFTLDTSTGVLEISGYGKSYDRGSSDREYPEWYKYSDAIKTIIIDEGWKSHIIGCLSFLLLKTSDIFRKAVHSVIRFARDYYKPRFDTEQVSDIKSALSLFGEDRQSHRAAGDFLYFTAKQKGGFDNREQIKARREVDNVVEGNYDQQQKRGFSMRR